MEDILFDASSILSDEEAQKLFDEIEQPQQQPEENPDEPEGTDDDNPAEEEEETPNPESVGEEEENDDIEDDTISPEGDGSSPKFYSSIANAFVVDGIFPDFDKETIDKIQSPEDFAELVSKAIDQRVTEQLDARIRRADEALNMGVQPDVVKKYEDTLQFLENIKPEDLAAEGEDGENLRKHIIFNDLLTRGYTKDRANREIEKSFKSGMDVDDAKDAYDALLKHFTDGYNNVKNEAKNKADAAKKAQQEQGEKFRKMILEDEVKVGDMVLDKKTCKKVFDSMMLPVYKVEGTNKLLTAVQKFQKENPLEFMKQMGIWFALTDGGKNISGLVKSQVQKEKNKGVKDLVRRINSTALDSDGSLRYAGSTQNGDDPLLDEGWKIGWD